MKKWEDEEKDEEEDKVKEEVERESIRGNERMHTTIMPLVFVTHVATVIVPITDPG